MKRLLSALVASVFIIGSFSGCMMRDEERLADLQWGVFQDYTLRVGEIGDTEMDVRTEYTGESEVPWSEGAKAGCFESSILKTKDGFEIPGEFIEKWREALTSKQVNYASFGAAGFADFGWVMYDHSGKESMYVEFQQPLEFLSLPLGDGNSQSAAMAKIMKFDTAGLYAPRLSEKGKPELEGEGLKATMFCTNIKNANGVFTLDYNVSISGSGTMRYYDTGVQFGFQGAGFGASDKAEGCTILIERTGYMEIGADGFVRKNTFTETWGVQSSESSVCFSESSLDGKGKTYCLEIAEGDTRFHGIGKSQRFPVVFNVMDYGATGDGASLDTNAINAAIENCSEMGGGIVHLPKGTYLSGSIHLKSEVIIKLDEGATILGSPDIADYDPRESSNWEYQDASQTCIHYSLIWGENLTNVAIIGPGTIDGNDVVTPLPYINQSIPGPVGPAFNALIYQFAGAEQRGPKGLSLKLCRNVLVKDVTFTRNPDEALFFAGCDNVLVEKYRAYEVQVDGIDPVCCNGLTITDSEIQSSDDSIAIKSSYTLGYERPCQNITVKNCIVSSNANALKIGTESDGDVTHIIIRDVYIRDPEFISDPSADPISSVFGMGLSGLSMISVDGNTLSDVVFSNITMTNVNWPIFMRLGDRLRSPEQEVIGKVTDITICDMSAKATSVGASYVLGMQDHPVGDRIVFRNINVTTHGGQTAVWTHLPFPPMEMSESMGLYPDPPYLVPSIPPAYGFFLRHVDGIEFHNVKFGFELPDWRPAIYGKDIGGILIDGLTADQAPGGESPVVIE
ncbi:MAG: glycosyl hydrolase family 28 protein [Candidatus Thermoplasmatota archaeon]|nr:glycosyl hydrolase family 28 protein [Candidatus Thermoplasmatota archaeon]